VARKYWLTVHWPPHHGENDSNPYVWLQEGKERTVAGMSKGDYVAVYEYATGPSELVDGVWRHRRRGAQAIIYYGRVTEIFPHVGEQRIFWRYGGEYPMTWICYAELKIIGRGGVGRVEVNRILGHGDDSLLRGFGPDNSGLMQVSREQFDLLTGR